MRFFYRRSELVFLLAIMRSTAAYAGPPYITDDPVPVETGHWEIDLSATGQMAKAGRSGFLPSVDINYGGFSDIQLHALIGISYDAAEGQRFHYGYGDTELGVKYRFSHQGSGSWWPELAIYPMLELPTGDASKNLGAGYIGAFLPVWLQKDFGNWQSYGGGGYRINPGPDNRNYWFFGALLQYQLTDALTLGGEVFHQTPSQRKSENSSATIKSRDATSRDITQAGVNTLISSPVGNEGGASTGFNLGGTYSLSDTYHILFTAGRGLQNAAAANQFSYYLGLQFTY